MSSTVTDQEVGILPTSCPKMCPIPQGDSMLIVSTYYDQSKPEALQLEKVLASETRRKLVPSHCLLFQITVRVSLVHLPISFFFLHLQMGMTPRVSAYQLIDHKV